MKILDILKAKKIGIIGFGKEGKSILSFLKTIGFKNNILIFDEFEDIFFDDKNDKIDTFFKKKSFNNLFNCDFYIKSPGISRRNFPEIQKKFEENKIISSTEIFLSNQEGKVIGITGTKGKSTTSSLIFSIFKEEFGEKKVKIIGNIGNPSLYFLDKKTEEMIFIFEFSSYQMEDLHDKNFLDLGILLNIFPDHLDYHLGFENYKKAKLNIKNISKTFIDFRDFDFEKGDLSLIKNLKLKGEHNKNNALIAVEIAKKMNISDISIKKAISHFTTLSYRLEEFKEKNRVWIDDSLSTNPDSTLAGVKAFEQKINGIILGGLDRGYDFSQLISYLSKIKNLKAIALLPENDLKILSLIEENFEKMPKIFVSNNMQKITQFLYENSEKNGVIMLSTASPSFFPYKNYIEKGDAFKKNVRKII